MKIKTNLDYSALEKVGLGLFKFAKSKRAQHVYTPANPAEHDLLNEVNSTMHELLDLIVDDLAKFEV